MLDWEDFTEKVEGVLYLLYIEKIPPLH